MAKGHLGMLVPVKDHARSVVCPYRTCSDANFTVHCVLLAMMSRLLKHLEQFPHPVFSESELRTLLSPRETENLMQQRILMVCASEAHGCPFSGACSHACPMCSFPHEDCIETSPFSREREIPSALRENGARRYALCLRQFLSVLHRVNGLHGQVHRLDRDGFYLGR